MRLEDGSAGQVWVLARQFCAFTFLDASAVPLPRRKGFAALAVQRWSPFADTRFHIDWVGSRAMVWAWSSGQILDLGDNEIAAPRRVSPESLYRGAPDAAGAQLLAMDEGVEGRVWQDHALVASQWWPAEPSLSEWNMLRRGAGLPAAVAVPAPEVLPLASEPWTRQRVEAFNDLASRHRKLLLAIALGLVIALISAPLVSSLRLGVKTLLLQRVIDTESQALRSTLEAREAAQRDLSRVRELLDIRPPQRQLRLLSSVAAAIPGSGWTLLEWRMPDRNSVELVLQMPNPDPTAIVTGLERTGIFGNVTVDIGRVGNEVAIKAEILGGNPLPVEIP